MADSIIHILNFKLFFFLLEPDLDLRLRVMDSLSRRLPSFGAISLPTGIPCFEAKCVSLLQGGGVILSS